MQVHGRLIVAAPGDTSGMLVYRGCSLATSEFATASVGTGSSSFSRHSSLTEMVGGVFPANMSLEKATMRPSKAVLLALE